LHEKGGFGLLFSLLHPRKQKILAGADVFCLRYPVMDIAILSIQANLSRCYMDIKQVTSSFAVSGQITAADLVQLKAAGYRTLICNRPDGEAEGQPAAEALAAEARAQGFDWHWIPISSGQFTDEAVAAFTQALVDRDELVLAFCRTGTRSITLWALAQAGQQPTAELLQLAREAGYDLSALAPRLNAEPSKD
jgi:uncharacterized protein (TIGR01244 family)